MFETIERKAVPAPSIRTRRALAPTLIQRVLLYIDANLENRIRNSDLAAMACLSVFYFNGVFRTSVGHSPHDYVIRRRVERAQGLMLSTDKTLAEIAAECGLTDQPHFTRLFRRFVGESPAAWRRAREYHCRAVHVHEVNAHGNNSMVSRTNALRPDRVRQRM
jgi:AraC family transcriptional regulator